MDINEYVKQWLEEEYYPLHPEERADDEVYKNMTLEEKEQQARDKFVYHESDIPPGGLLTKKPKRPPNIDQ